MYTWHEDRRFRYVWTNPTDIMVYGLKLGNAFLKEAGDIAGLAQAKTSWRRLPKISVGGRRASENLWTAGLASNRITETRKLIHLLL